MIEHLHVTWAIHRLQGVDCLFACVIFVHFDDKHVLLIAFPVTRGLPKLAVYDLRCVYLDIATCALTAAHVVLQFSVDGPAVRVPKHLTGGLFLHVKQVHLAAQLAVIAQGCLLKAVQVIFQTFFVCEGCTIDALQHRTVTIAAPVSARNVHQLKAIRRHLACVLQVRTTAEVLPIAVPIHAQGLVTRNALDQLDLIGLAFGLVMGNRFRALPNLGADRFALVDDLFHLLFNDREVLGCERLLAVEVVVPAVFDHRADGDLHVRPDFLHGAGHDVGEVVANQLQRRLFVLHCVDRDCTVCIDRPLKVPMGSVNGCRNRLFGQGCGDVSGHFAGCDASVILTCVTIGKCQGDLGHLRHPRLFSGYKALGCGFMLGLNEDRGLHCQAQGATQR